MRNESRLYFDDSDHTIYVIQLSHFNIYLTKILGFSFIEWIFLVRLGQAVPSIPQDDKAHLIPIE